MKSKDFFEYAQCLDFDVERVLKQIEKVDRLLAIDAVSYDKEGKSGVHATDSMSDRVAQLMDFKNDLKALEQNYIEEQRKMEYVIRHIANPWQRQAVGLRYVHNMSLSDIGKKMGYTTSGVNNLLKRCFKSTDKWIVDVLDKYKKEQMDKNG